MTLLENPAAVWSAIAASCSAFAAITMVVIQRRNLIESIRPELVVLKWEKENIADGTILLKYGSIKNVGRGPAFNVVVYFDPTFGGPSAIAPIIASNDVVSSEGWQHICPTKEQPIVCVLCLRDHILSWDSSGRRYVTSFDVNLYRLEDPKHLVYGCVAPGIGIVSRSYKSRGSLTQSAILHGKRLYWRIQSRWCAFMQMFRGNLQGSR